jgi:hypothetical protein
MKDYSKVIREIERKYNGPWLPNEGASGLTGPKSCGTQTINGINYYIELIYDYKDRRTKVERINNLFVISIIREEKLKKLNNL